MKKHLGWVVRMLIAAAGVAYILYTLTWSDQVFLPAGYFLTPGVHGAEAGQTYHVLDERDDAYRIGRKADGNGTGPDGAWIAKSELEPGGGGPQFKPSFITILSQSDGRLLLAGLVLFLPILFIGALRWWVLMRARGVAVGSGRVLRLTLAGYFFNLCMPGTTGGDLMKAYYAAKSTHQRADAVVSIVIDRLCGLVGLVLLVGVVGLLSLDDVLIRRLTITMWCGLVLLLVVAWLYTSRAVRARLRLGGLIGKVPGAGLFRKIDAWVTAYRNHVGALLLAIALSVPIHLCLTSAMALAGFALGVDQPMLYLLTTIPIVLILWSLPVSGPLGLGPLDYVAVQLIVGTSETTAQQALMMFVAFRLYLVGIGLCGSLSLVGIGARLEIDDATHADPCTDAAMKTD